MFSDPRLRAAEKMDYGRTYGFILSGDLANVKGEFMDYIKVFEDQIMMILTNTTDPMSVSLFVYVCVLFCDLISFFNRIIRRENFAPMIKNLVEMFRLYHTNV
jgi:hypothetical protein